MKKRIILKWIIFAIALAINLFIVANSFVNGEGSTAESSIIVTKTAEVINDISPGSINNDNIETFSGIVRKLFGHFGLFCVSGLFSTWAFYLFARGSKFNYYLHFGGLSLFGGIVVAWLSETIQLFVPGRSASAFDVVIDVVGYFIGVLLVIFILFFTKKPIFSKLNKEEK